MEALGKQWYNNGARDQKRAVSASVLVTNCGELCWQWELWPCRLSLSPLLCHTWSSTRNVPGFLSDKAVEAFPQLVVVAFLRNYLTVYIFLARLYKGLITQGYVGGTELPAWSKSAGQFLANVLLKCYTGSSHLRNPSCPLNLRSIGV